MRPILVQWRGRRIHSYPAFLYLGLMAGIASGNYTANVAGLDSKRVLIATLLLIIPALIGSRLLFVATHWRVYRRDPGRIWRRSDGGAALQGGLLPAVGVSIPLLPLLGLQISEFWDVATVTMLTALVFGRFGCILHGCCSGRPSEGRLALYLPNHRGVWRKRIPVQLFEAGCAALLLAGAAVVWNDRPFPGAIFLMIVASYGLVRTALQPFRETQDRVGSWNVQGTLSAVLATAAMGGLFIAWLARG